jgi:predicted amidohydrolase YtcJ
VVASVQPTHAPGVLFPYEPSFSRIGGRKLPFAYAWQTIREAGANMMFNSDWPVGPLNPMLTFMAALIRKPHRKGDPEQRQTFEQILEGYTSGAAYAEFMEHRKGRLKEGMLADIAVFSADIEQTPPDRLPEVRVSQTICDGKITHSL